MLYLSSSILSVVQIFNSTNIFSSFAALLHLPHSTQFTQHTAESFSSFTPAFMASSALYLVLLLLLFVVLSGSTTTTPTAETLSSSNITRISPLMAAKTMKDKVATTTLGIKDICVPGLPKPMCRQFRCPCCMVGGKFFNRSTITAKPAVKDVVTMLGNVADQVCRPGLSKAMCCSFRCPCCSSVSERAAYRNMTNRTAALPSMDGGKDVPVDDAVCGRQMTESMCCSLRCPCCRAETKH